MVDAIALAYRRREPVHFLNEFVFGPYPSEIRAVGFKIFPEHFFGGRFQSVVDEVLRDTDVCLFHLRRRNQLAVLLSLKRAQLSKVWSSRLGREQENGPLELSIEDCERFFRKRFESERQIDSLLESRGDCRQLIYEDFVADFERSMTALQEAIEVEVRPLAPALRKLNTKPVADGISNFEQLTHAFAGTPWQKYFEDSA